MIIGQSGPVTQLEQEALLEVASMFEEPVQVKRYTGTTGGDDSGGVAATPTYTTFYVTANITALEAKEIMFSQNTYAVGDLKAEFRLPIYGPESFTGDNQTAGRQADQVVYRGRLYKIVGHVMTPILEGIPYWQAVLRQVG